jgi:hypothetical protein
VVVVLVVLVVLGVLAVNVVVVVVVVVLVVARADLYLYLHLFSHFVRLPPSAWVKRLAP